MEKLTRNPDTIARKRWTEDEENEVIRLFNSGLGYKSIAKVIGRAPTSVHKVIMRAYERKMKEEAEQSK